MRVVDPTKSHEAFHKEFVDLLRKHLANEQADVLLAIAAYAVGQLVAMQDQRRMTPIMAMEIVARNIEAGNQNAIQAVMNSKGRA